MKIAIASDGMMVSGHFGHCEGFVLYDVEDNNISNKTFISNPGHRPGFLPNFLQQQGASMIIAGGMGETAQQLFQENEIQVIVGARGNCDEVINQYLEGKLSSTGSVCREHVHEGHCNG